MCSLWPFTHSTTLKEHLLHAWHREFRGKRQIRFLSSWSFLSGGTNQNLKAMTQVIRIQWRKYRAVWEQPRSVSLWDQGDMSWRQRHLSCTEVTAAIAVTAGTY